MQVVVGAPRLRPLGGRVTLNHPGAGSIPAGGSKPLLRKGSAGSSNLPGRGSNPRGGADVKLCKRCGQTKPHEAFNRRGKDGLQPVCRSCQADWYRENKADHTAHVRANAPKYQQRNREHVWAYLREHPCVDCGEADIRVLEFDHLRDKIHAISQMVRWAVSLRRLQAEIDKCEVVCANCHRRRTATRGNWVVPD